jgi:uncharacterized protein YraI
MKNLIAASVIFLGLGVPSANAAIVDTGSGTPTAITSLYTYSDYGGGDVIFSIATTLVGCEGGFWLRPTDAGFERNLSLAMSAKLTGKSVRISAYNDSLWSGSGTKYCRLHSIGIL